MGKNRSASGITNVIQYDNNGNITFVSGSTTLMQVSSSGAITTTGVISGSNALSASFSLNSALFNDTGSVGFATTASLLTVSSSQQQISASLLQVSASQQQLSSSFLTLTASFNAVSSSQQQISSSLLNVISIFATTGSNSFRATQSITGSLTVTGQIIAQTLNVQQVTSSIIYSSGSNNFGCDLNSRQTFTGSVFITGSGIIANVGSACFSGTATIGSDILLSAANPVIYGGTAVGGVSVSNNTGGSYIKIFGACHATTPNVTSFVNANSTSVVIDASGRVGIGTPTPCSVLHVYGVNPSLIIQNSNTSTVGNTSNIIFRNLLSTGCIHFAGYIAGIQKSTSDNTGDLSFNTYNNGSIVEGMRITSTGATCFACRVCAPNINLSNGISINACSTVTVADWYNTNTDDGNGLYIKAGGVNSGKYVMALENATGASRMIVLANGNVGIGCSTPLNRLTVNGCIGMSNTYNWGITNDNDTNWGFRVCSAASNFSTFISYAGDAGSDRRGGIYNQNGHWVAYGNCQGHFIVQCNLTVGGSISGAGINGTLLTTQTQRLVNSTGGFANMVQKIHGAAGSFSSLVICVNLVGAGGWGYIINSGGTGLGQFQSGGGYINGPGNYSHGVAVGSGFTVTCHTCAGTDNVVRFVSSGGVHPFVSIQMFGSLNQPIDDSNIFIAYS